MRDKDKENILNDIKVIVKQILLKGFKNRMHRVVDSVEQIHLLNYEIIPDEDDRDLILIHHLQVGARVFVIFGHDAKSSDNIVLKSKAPLQFILTRKLTNMNWKKLQLNFMMPARSFTSCIVQ